jgi:hypothetical protein
MKIGKLAMLVAFVSQALLLGGCATSAVWQEGQFARYHDPADPPNLVVAYSASQEDYLVQYTEIREGDGLTARRAYWLNHETGHKKPRFVPLSAAHGLEPVPVFNSQSAASLPTTLSRFAVLAMTGASFTLYHGEEKLGTYDLPDYPDSSGRIKQVLLTPPAFVADVTVVGGVIAVYTLPWWGSALAEASNR